MHNNCCLLFEMSITWGCHQNRLVEVYDNEKERVECDDRKMVDCDGVCLLCQRISIRVL